MITKDTPVNELYHYGVPGMRWGVRRYTNEDGTLTALGKSRLRGYDGDDYKSYSDSWTKAESYVNSYERTYGKAPVNRLRFDYVTDESFERGRSYCSNYDWNNTSLDKIYDAYSDYLDSRDWD